jgi:glycosyltransferase involved in cell wall biosynthesis
LKKFQKKILFLIGEDHYFMSHRFELAQSFQRAGFSVAIATRCNTHQKTIEAAGIQVFPLQHLRRGHQSLRQSLQALYELFKIYKEYEPDVAFHVAIKPLVFGTSIAFLARVPRVINALGGLGHLFTPSSAQASISRLQRWKQAFFRQVFSRCVRLLLWLTPSTLVLQNEDDKATLISAGCLPLKPKPDKVVIILGCGINPLDYPVTPFPPAPPINIVCVSRMLWDKGIGELVEAAKQCHVHKLPVNIILYGTPDLQNPATISEEQLQQWHDAGIIEWRGFCDSVATAYADSHIAVLPSYREGLPKSLLEAASCGRPIIATDVPGCRSIVTHEVNGLLIRPKDSQSLFEAIRHLAQSPELREKFGKSGHARIEKDFLPQKIHTQFIGLLKRTFNSGIKA